MCTCSLYMAIVDHVAGFAVGVGAANVVVAFYYGSDTRRATGSSSRIGVHSRTCTGMGRRTRISITR